MTINYKLWTKTFPYICISCNKILNSKLEQCEYCGEKEIRKSNKKDYKKRRN